MSLNSISSLVTPPEDGMIPVANQCCSVVARRCSLTIATQTAKIQDQSESHNVDN